MKNTIIILFLFISFFASSQSYAAISVLDIDIANGGNGHRVIKSNEGSKEVLKININNKEGNVGVRINGGADKEFFEFNQKKSLLSFKENPDFEQAKDSDKNNIYRVSLEIKGKEHKITQSLWINVQNIFNQSEKKIFKKRVVRNKHKRWVCKNSKALNFNNMGRHKESLCEYESDKLAKSLENAKKILLLLEKELKKNKLQALKLKKEKIKNNLKKGKKKKGVRSNVAIQEKELYGENIVFKREGENFGEKKMDKENTVNLGGGEEKNIRNQSASIVNSSSNWANIFSWTFWIITAAILSILWAIWKIFRIEN